MVGKHHYRLGAGRAVVTPDAVVLVGANATTTLVDAIWNAMQGGPTPEELLDAILALGLRNLPSIGIVHIGDVSVRLLVRGDVRAVVKTEAEAQETISASEALTWVEQACPGSSTVTLELQGLEGSTQAPGDSGYPIIAGVVAAESVTVSAAGSKAGAHRRRVQATVREPPIPLVESGPSPLSRLSPSPNVETSEPQHVIEREGSPGRETRSTSTKTESHGDLQQTLTATELPEGPGRLPPPARAPQPHDSIPANRGWNGSSDSDTEDEFDDLFGATRQPLPTEHAAVRPAEELRDPVALRGTGPSGTDPSGSDWGDEPSGPSGRIDPSVDISNQRDSAPPLFPLAGGGANAGVEQPPAALVAGSLIDSVPGISSRLESGPGAGTAAPGRGQTEEQVEEHRVDLPPAVSKPPGGFSYPREEESTEDAGMTVSSARPTRLKAPPSGPGLLTGGPMVHGVWCPGRHPNPPSATRCRICELPIADADPVTMPRPVLGRLRFSNGSEVVLERSAIIGRSPRAERVSAQGIPQLISVASPDQDISRSHLEVRLDGWHVLIVDLHSTNGTVVTAPGQAPERLRGGEEVPIAPGTLVSLADDLTFVYEVE